MTDKTLGQLNFEAWLPEWLHPVVKWEEIPSAHREQWETAAQAVAREYRADKLHVSMQAVLRNGERAMARDAVIEAARELLRISRHYRLDSTEGKVAAAKVIQVIGALDALEALEAAEKGDE